MAPRRRIIITGFMGAGKSTVAAALARRLGCGHIDLDKLIAEREGRTIREMFERDGESGFREAETRALRDALERTEAGVIALGGGTWTLERNRALIAEHKGYAVWLDTPFDVCWRRITSGGKVRPLARDHEKTRKLYDERRALYELAALHVRAGGRRSAREVVDEIANAISFSENP